MSFRIPVIYDEDETAAGNQSETDESTLRGPWSEYGDEFDQEFEQHYQQVC